MINLQSQPLLARSPLAHEKSRRMGRPDGAAGLSLRPIPDPWFIHLAARQVAGDKGHETLAKTVMQKFGGGLPPNPIRVAHQGLDILWAGPRQWFFFVQNRQDRADLRGELSGAVKDLAAITDQSDGRVFLQVAGTAWRDCLASLLPIDLHPRVFMGDSVAITHAHHMPAMIWGDGEQAAILAVPRAYADSLFHALVAAGSRFGIDWLGAEG
ncbi:MAG: sarcosine oxidase subunit gamma family protein [Candidatus Symbiobacter sp.]|nr:sarcosine oxidase subunit gamma family protein [Candidatus Symbiobacter sp.]